MSPLVSPSWLAARLHEAGTVILDATLPPVGVTPPVDTRARYLTAHIPGAVFFDIEEVSDHSTSLPHMLPPPDGFGRSMSAVGVAKSATIVVYEQGDVFSAPRAWWMLRTMGAREVYVLDGGLRAWIDACLPTESGTVHRAPSHFHAALDEHAVKDFAEVQGLLARGAQVLDARSAGRYSGVAPEPRPGLSSGHMPGAISTPFAELTDAGRMRTAESLREIFSAKGVNTAQPITTTCGSGVTAAVVALALELVGAPQVSLYDGSWAEYAQHPDAVIETAL